MEYPIDWPPDIRTNYEPLRVLGKGGFASVVLAKRNGTDAPIDETTTAPTPIPSGTLVAIKVVGSAQWGVTKQERLYAHREIEILQALSHPNLMKCFDYFEPPPSSSSSSKGSGAILLLLSYSPGPTVEYLLKQGGALSTLFGRVILAQLIDALAYLHSHAVVHRDIKPDNIIITGAMTTQPEIWDNPPQDEDEEQRRTTTTARPDWLALRTKWHVTLIDFGFARALTKEDVHQPSQQLLRENMDASFHQSNFGLPSLQKQPGLKQPPQKEQPRGDDDDDDSKLTSSGTATRGGGGSGIDRSLNRSLSSSLRPSRHGNQRVSTMLHRRMSALGSPQFAAPEIKHKVVRKSPSVFHEDESAANPSGDNNSNNYDITKTISPFVADYGLLVDAYSLGCTIRYMMTGCPPHQSVADAIASQNSMVEVLCGMCAGAYGRSRRRNTTPPPKRAPRYRYVKDLPKDVQRLIESMTVHDPTQRASVRAARRYPWINDVLTAENDENDDENRDDGRPHKILQPSDIQYLHFSHHAAEQEDHAKHSSAICTA